MGFCGQKCTFTFVSLMKTIACMTVLKVVDDSIYCSRLVMDCLQGYEHDFHSRQFKETFSPQREAENAISSIYLTERWQALHLNYQILKEHQREIPPRSRCFATLTLEYVFNRGLCQSIITKTT